MDLSDKIAFISKPECKLCHISLKNKTYSRAYVVIYAIIHCWTEKVVRFPQGGKKRQAPSIIQFQFEGSRTTCTNVTLQKGDIERY